VAAGLVAVGGTASAKEACLKYEPEIVKLVGVTTRHTFPGPPNYESVKKGDAPERYWLLRLPRPVCVRPSNLADDTQGSVSSSPVPVTAPGSYQPAAWCSTAAAHDASFLRCPGESRP